MSTLHDLRVLMGIRQVNANDVRWLWHCDYYDGPLSGLVMFEGAEAWVDCFDEIVAGTGEGDERVCTRTRRFALLRLTPAELAAEKADHILFEKYVGTHTTYSADGKRDVGVLRPQGMRDTYYAAGHKGHDYSQHDVIAWYEE